MVGNLSPKGCVGDSRLDPVCGRNWENQINRCDLSAKGCLPVKLKPAVIHIKRLRR
ncbi:MAG: hypothetical protein LBG58_06525 [Planctomycetaceae bacterium]|nr:hypothetical protein [Planctomycetaceae bacterium]